jgi:predicted transcriptional regulator
MSENWRDYEDIKIRWHLFINQEYVKFRGNSRKTIQDFATMLNTSQPMMSQYMKPGGRVPTSHQSIKKFYDYFGDVIYEVLNLPIPKNDLSEMPERFIEFSNQVKETIAEYKVSGTSDEAGDLVIDIMKKFVEKYKDTNHPSTGSVK